MAAYLVALIVWLPSLHAGYKLSVLMGGGSGCPVELRNIVETGQKVSLQETSQQHSDVDIQFD